MWQIAKKDLIIFLSDRRALFLSMLLPVGLISLFAFAYGGVGGSEEESTPIVLLYTDQDNSATTNQLIADIDSIPGIAMLNIDINEGLVAIQKGEHIAQIIFYQGFADSLFQNAALPAELRYDYSNEMEVSILQNLLMNKLAQLQGAAANNAGIESMLSTIYPNANDSIRQQIKNNFYAQTMRKAPLLKMSSVVGATGANWALIQAVAGTAIMMLLFSVSAIGTSIIEEKESGVLKKLLQSPLHPFEILSGKMLSSFIIAVFQLVIMFTFSWLVLGLHITEYLPETIVMLLVTAITCTSFGVLLAAIASSKRQADAMRTIIILFMSAIGGSMVPLYIMPKFMQDLAVISVNYWSIQAFYDIFWRQTGFSGIADNIIILLSISLILLLGSFYFFRKNILKVIA